MIDLSKLPKEIQDIIELREERDPTFYRFVECIVENQLLPTVRGFKKAKEVEECDELFGIDGKPVKVLKKWNSTKECLRIHFDSSLSVEVSVDHKMMMSNKKIVPAKNLVVGDSLYSSKIEKIDGGDMYDIGWLAGVYFADGHAVALKREDTDSGYGTVSVKVDNNQKEVLERFCFIAKNMFGFSSYSIRKYSSLNATRAALYGAESVREFIKMFGSKNENKVIPTEILQSEEGVRGFVDGFSTCDFGCNIYGKQTQVGYSINSYNVACVLLYCLHSLGVNPTVKYLKHVQKTEHRTIKKGSVSMSWVIRIPADQVNYFLSALNIVGKEKKKKVDEVIRVREERGSDNWPGRKTTFEEINGVRIPIITKIEEIGERNCVDFDVDGDDVFQIGAGIVVHNSDYTDIWWNILAERANPEVEHAMLSSITGMQGSGKSYSAISMCAFLDPTFSVDNIFFDYNDLVYNRGKLKPNTAVLVDEQSQSFGLDSHRVMIILANLKEQLRKKSIHFFFCSPTLYEESKSSMYLLETMFIDYETRESYACLKTREGLTLGHVRIPHPLNELSDGSSLVTKEFLDAYEAKKDRHLEKVLGNRSQDIFEERAQAVMKNPLFKKVEKKYKRAMGYIPQSTLIQVINKLYPEFHAGVVPVEIAGRIKLDKELTGEWSISGRGRKKK